MKPTKIYAEILEDEALKQFNDAMSLDCVVQGALMPDAHSGYTLPIGAVIKTKDKIFPSFVGFDIGCGMSATKLSIDKEQINLEKLKCDILERIPLGRETHKTPRNIDILTTNISTELSNIVSTTGKLQIGTLGGGNHFIEIGTGEDGKVWIIIHSGSRGLGHKIATHYMTLAYIKSLDGKEYEIKNEFEERNKSFKEHNPEGYEKAIKKFISTQIDKLSKKADIEGMYSLDLESEDGKQYQVDLDYSLQYALKNRAMMTEAILEAISIQTKVEIEEFINRNHNHAEIKDGFVIHRKGATHAEKDMLGVIPGNMKDGSFIVKGKGNDDSMCSSSHGAGRVLSRTQAIKQLDVNEFHKQMEGITTNHTDSNLDEAPLAYKNIFQVMEAQKELVEIIDHIKPILNIKG